MQQLLTFDAPLAPVDAPRLSEQVAAVHEAMSNHDWWTYEQLRRALGGKGIAASEAGISARVRDLRKPPLNLTVERKRIAEGLFAYRIAK